MLGGELGGELELGLVVLRDGQQAGGVLVDTVDEDAEALVFGLGALGEAEAEREGVHKGAVVVAVARMDDHARGLVHDEHVLVLIDDVERNVFGEDFHPAAPVGHHELDRVAGADHEIGFGDLVVHEDAAFLDRGLDPGAGGVFEVGGHELVDALGLLPGVDAEAEMLKQTVLQLVPVVQVGQFHGGYSAGRARRRLTSWPIGTGRFEAPGAWLVTTAFRESL